MVNEPQKGADIVGICWDFKAKSTAILTEGPSDRTMACLELPVLMYGPFPVVGQHIRLYPVAQ